MRHRASKEQVCEQAKIDHESICQEHGFSFPTVAHETDMDTIQKSVKRAMEAKGMEFARSIEEMKEAIKIAETEEDWLLIVKHWMGRLLQNGRILSHHTYKIGGGLIQSENGMWLIDREKERTVRLGFEMINGSLTVDVGSGIFAREKHLKLEGKPTRVLTKIFGEEFVTFMCQRFPIRKDKLHLHLTKSYIPEHYINLREDEDLDSCMSHNSCRYDLSDNYHPVMAYEGSPNAVLCLIYSEHKKRYISRAIGMIDCGKLLFNRVYGASGCHDAMIEFGVQFENQLNGLKLTKTEVDGAYLFPYVDGEMQNAVEEGDYLIVDEDGDLECSYETGRVLRGWSCGCCGDSMAPDDEPNSTEDGNVCNRCFEWNYHYVERRDAFVHESLVTYCESVERYEHEDDVVYCDFTNEYYPDNVETVEVERRRYGSICKEIVVRDNLEDALVDWIVVSVDGEPIEEEEDAA